MLGVQSFGSAGDPLTVLVGGVTMMAWPDPLCERLAAGGRWVVRYDLRDCGESTTIDPERPGYALRDLAADAATRSVLRVSYTVAGARWAPVNRSMCS